MIRQLLNLPLRSAWPRSSLCGMRYKKRGAHCGNSTQATSDAAARPQRRFPAGFDSGILPSALRADACGVVQNRSRRFCRSIGPDYFVARLANARRPFGAACASYPSQCARYAAHAEIRDRVMYVRSLGRGSESDLEGNTWFTGRTMRSLTNAMKMS